MSNGDWYCRSCGYIVAQRVTSSETCDTCHQPVEWHDAEQRGAVEQIQQQLAAAQAEALELREKLGQVWEAGRRMHAMLYALGEPIDEEWRRVVAALSQPAEYRLLTRADKIEATDELLRDDCVTWAPVAGDLCKGMQYNPDFFVPVRRRVGAAPAAQEGRDDA